MEATSLNAITPWGRQGDPELSIHDGKNEKEDYLIWNWEDVPNNPKAIECQPEFFMAPYVEEIVFLGTGTSGQVPTIHCLTQKPPKCKTCLLANEPGNYNRRRNTSLLLRIAGHKDERIRNVVIDVGKSFFESSLHWYPKYGFRELDAVILTHEHADAMLGLDDLRDWTLFQSVHESIPIYLDRKTLNHVQKVFPYLVDTNQATGSGLVSSLSFHEFSTAPGSSFNVHGIEFKPFIVLHGPNFFSLGFRFDDISYASDVSEILPAARADMEHSDIIILDCLKETNHISHFGFDTAVKEAQFFSAHQTFFTGMCHDLEHHDCEKRLLNIEVAGNGRINMAYDGLRVLTRRAKAMANGNGRVKQ